MASLGKVSASAISLPTELTIAAAAFNIDFTLLKIEAPKEYQGLGNALSANRRAEAENGQSHITARRLGALFDSKLTRVPHLIDAYGKRVSEICATTAENAQKFPEGAIFGAQMGADGTNIWAGATSGSGALAVHLLSCLLARIWKSHEAISLWVELVEKRKQEIMSSFNSGSATEAASVMAAQQMITREQLAAWDASARSWLHTADSAKRLQQIQLMLIMSNISMPVNSSNEPYESVMKAWISAMEAMEHLVQGMPQRVQDGTILLAISSWHLYPNMHILVDQPKEVDQKDPLMNGALVTISGQQSSTGREGVYWSLPLARMRYYSPPEVAERRIASDTSRVTIDELWIVILGILIGPWAESDLDQSCEFIHRLAKQVNSSGESVRWLDLISKAAHRYLEAEGWEREQVTKLLRLGSRRGKRFLSQYENTMPLYFQLNDFSVLLGMFIENTEGFPGLGPMEKITVLRHIAQGLRCSPDDLIIRFLTVPKINDQHAAYGYASALPVTRKSLKRSRDETETLANGHVRWIVASYDIPMIACEGSCSCTQGSQDGCCCSASGEPCTEFCHSSGLVCQSFRSVMSFRCFKDKRNYPEDNGEEKPELKFNKDCDGDEKFKRMTLYNQTCSGRSNCHGCYNRKVQAFVGEAGEECQLVHDVSDEPGASCFKLGRSNAYGQLEMAAFEYLIGDLSTASIFKREHVQIERNPQAPGNSQKAKSGVVEGVGKEEFFYPSTTASLDDIEAILAEPSCNNHKLVAYLRNIVSTSPSLDCSFAGLEFATSIYENLDGATVNLEILNLTMSTIQWTQKLSTYPKNFFEPTTRGPSPRTFTPNLAPSPDSFSPGLFDNSPNTILVDDLERSFACLAMFESGQFDIAPQSLRSVFALSSGDSIFVYSALLADPTVESSKLHIKRVLGNLGRPGMTFLVSPAKPRLKEHNLASWHLVNHFPFDGEFRNSFTGTSLHLSFTDFEMPLDIGWRGLRDTPVVLVEALVSLDDRGKALGELDVIQLCGHRKYAVLQGCQHTCTSITPSGSFSTESISHEGWLRKSLVSIDCWDEFFDFPNSRGIFRGSGNWQARWAAVAASIQQGKKVLVLPPTPCLKCLGSYQLIDFDVIVG
jgi:hypothetical protein